MWIVIHYYKWQQSWWSPASYAWFFYFFIPVYLMTWAKGLHYVSAIGTCIVFVLIVFFYTKIVFFAVIQVMCVFFWPSSFTIGCDSKWCVLEGECSVTFVYWFCVWGNLPNGSWSVLYSWLTLKSGQIPTQNSKQRWQSIHPPSTHHFESQPMVKEDGQKNNYAGAHGWRVPPFAGGIQEN